ncbi:hypothetical protein D3C71_2041740 [compost metagenome]
MLKSTEGCCSGQLVRPWLTKGKSLSMRKRMRSSKLSALEKMTPSAMRLRTICLIGSIGCTLRNRGVMTT